MTNAQKDGKSPLMEITRDNLLSLIQNGLKQQGLSITALEKQAGVPKDTVRDFLRAKTQILRADKLQKIVRILQPEQKLAIRAELNAHAQIVPLPEGSEITYVDFPPGLDNNTVAAVHVRGEAMAPVFLDGWVIYYTTSAHAPVVNKAAPHVPYNPATASSDPFAAFLGKPCIIRLQNDTLMLRTLKAGENGTYTLAAYNTPDISNASVKDVYKIVFIKTN